MCSAPELAPVLDASPPPCFFWVRCRAYAVCEKQGKSVCTACAGRLSGAPYPLRPPARQPLYLAGRDAAEAMDMIESGHKKLNSQEPLAARRKARRV